MSRKLQAVIVLSTLLGISMWVAAFVTLQDFLSRRNGPGPLGDVKDPGWHQEVAQAFQGPVQVDDKLRTELQRYFERLAAAVRAGNQQQLLAFFDVKRMGAEIFRTVDLPQWQREAFLRGLEMGLARGIVHQLDAFGGPRHEIKAVKQLAAPDELAVIVRHHLRGGASSRNRWWLKRGPGGWRIYDLESLDIGFRLSTFGATQVPAIGRGPLPAWLHEAAFFDEVRQALQANNLDQAEKALQRVARVQFPNELEGCRWMVTGLVQLQRKQAAEGLKSFDKAASFAADMPTLDLLRSNALNMLGQHDKALVHVRRYTALLGEDNETYHQTGVALAGLGRPDEAQECFRKGLKDEPNSPGTVDELRKLLPAGKKGEIAGHFLALSHPGKEFYNLANDAWQHNDLEGVEVLASAMRRRNAREPDAAFFLARLKGRARKLEEAIALYKAAVAGQPDGKIKEEYVCEMLQDAIAARKPVAGYEAAPDPDFAFRFLQGRLQGDFNADSLREVIQAHRRRRPRDAVVVFAEACLCLDEGELDQAERAFAALDPARLDVATQKTYWARRVDLRFQQGKGLSAYTDLNGPKKELFQLVAQRYYGPERLKDLHALVEAHRKNEPADPNLFLWDADLHERQKDHAAVVRILLGQRRLILLDKNRRSRFFNLLLPSLYQAGRADEARREIEALVVTKGPDAEQEFRTLANRALAPQNVQMLEDLALALRRHRPDDPDGPFNLARARIHQGKTDEALRLFKEALARQPAVDKRAGYVDSFLLAMMDAGKLLEGYQAAPDPAFALRAMADELLEQGRFDELGRLLEAHKKRRPDDAWLCYYQAELHIEHKQYEQADKALADGVTHKLDPKAQISFRYQRVFVRFQLGKGLSAYADFGPKKEVFTQLAQLCAGKKDIKQLDALLALHRRHDPGDPNLLVWEAEVKWLAGDYAAAVTLLRQHRDGVLAQPANRWKLYDHLVRGLVRLRRPDEALKQAEAAQKDSNNLLLLAVAHAAAGDVARTGQVLERCMHRHFQVATFYADPDLGPLLRSDRFRVLWQRYPPPKDAGPPAA